MTARNNWLDLIQPAAVQTSSLDGLPARATALRAAALAMQAGSPVDEKTASWLAAALLEFLDRGGDLTAILGLRPTRGGRYQSVSAAARIERRNRLLCAAIILAPGDSLWSKATAVSDALKNKPALSVSDLPVFKQALERNGAPAPKTPRQLVKIFTADSPRCVWNLNRDMDAPNSSPAESEHS